MVVYISKPDLVGDLLTSGDMQRRVRDMTGLEVYHEVLRIINEMPGIALDERAAAGAADGCAACKTAHPGCDRCCYRCDDQCNAFQRCKRGEVTNG